MQWLDVAITIVDKMAYTETGQWMCNYATLPCNLITIGTTKFVTKLIAFYSPLFLIFRGE